MAMKTGEIFKNAKTLGHTELAIHAKKAFDGLDGMVRYLEEVRSALWESMEPINVPVIDVNRPKLTLIKGGG